MLKIHQIFKSSRAAIDLASIMVGIIIIGLIGSVIAATVFAVIPWTQDKAAKQQLESIHTAENAYYGLSTATDSNLTNAIPSSFTDSDGLAVNNLLTTAPNYCVIAVDGLQNYTAYSRSGSGKVFFSTNDNKQPRVYDADLPDDCSYVAGGQPAAPAVANLAFPEGNVGVPYSYTVSASGFPRPTFSISELPAGLTINPKTGLISGTPTAQFGKNVTVTVSNDQATITKASTLTIKSYPATKIYYNTFGANSIIPIGSTLTGNRYLGYPTVGSGANTNSNQSSVQLETTNATSSSMTIKLPKLDPGTYEFTTWASPMWDGKISLAVNGQQQPTVVPIGYYSKSVITPIRFTVTDALTPASLTVTFAPNHVSDWYSNITYDDITVSKVG
jgi:type II secretory pathway pseudopilin PulG